MGLTLTPLVLVKHILRYNHERRRIACNTLACTARIAPRTTATGVIIAASQFRARVGGPPIQRSLDHRSGQKEGVQNPKNMRWIHPSMTPSMFSRATRTLRSFSLLLPTKKHQRGKVNATGKQSIDCLIAVAHRVPCSLSCFANKSCKTIERKKKTVCTMTAHFVILHRHAG